ncbi:MAG: arginine--tRNA ligase [Acidobacteriota bacterium]|nr:arginine--tRNA ligase [Acidobacteriota bacterium]
MPYALEKAKQEIADLLAKATGTEVLDSKSAPPNVDADLAVPIFPIAKQRGVNPAALAQELADGLDLEGTLLAAVTATGGFVNFKLADDAFTRGVFADFAQRGADYGGSAEGAGRTVVVDFSSPNIAKPFSVGHLRSTVIGQALVNLHEFLGFKVVGDNHIGDWGTQFGKLLYAFEVWGDREKVAQEPIRELLALYVRFHEEAQDNPAMEDEARAWFRRLEEGDEKARELWEWFREVSWTEFQRVYDLLGVRFDEVLGESFYNDQLDDVVDEAFDKGLAEWSELAPRTAVGDGPEESASAEPERVAIIPLAEHGIETPLLVRKSDGTSLYATRDLATIKYRVEHWAPEAILYVVGGEQRLYFQQLFQAAELLGYGAQCEHVPFGLIRLPKGRMSTRKGRVIFLEDVLDEAISRAEAVLEDRELSDDEKATIARMVGIGAVKWADLSQTRTKDVLFDWDKMLNLQGDSAPYLQYAYVRTLSMLRKAPEGLGEADPDLLGEPSEVELVKALARFPEAVAAAVQGRFPHLVATYLIALARDFSSFYNQVPVLQAETPELVAARLELCRMTAQVIRRGLGLLGIECPEHM